MKQTVAALTCSLALLAPPTWADEMYCNSGSLSAQAVFALRLLGHDNVKVLQDGFDGWKKKGGFDAHVRASQPSGH